MPLWRKLYVKIVDSPDVNDMPDDFTRLLWVILPLQLDRRGRGLDNSAWVRSKCFPLREDVTVAMVDAALEWYAERRMIERYEDNGRRLFWLPKWHKYQGKCDREAESDRAAPSSYEGDDAPPPELPPYSGPTHELVPTSSRLEESRVEESRGVQETSPTAPAYATPTNLDGWIALLKVPPPKTNRTAILHGMGEALWPDYETQPFSRFGQVAKRVGGSERLAQLMWTAQAGRVTGDYLAYCEAMSKRSGTVSGKSTLDRNMDTIAAWGEPE